MSLSEDNNTAVSGGGNIFVDCRFENNYTAVSGGNTYEGCAFDDSIGRAVYGGGAFANCSLNNTAAVEHDCSFNKNSGGAVYGGGTKIVLSLAILLLEMVDAPTLVAFFSKAHSKTTLRGKVELSI